MKYKPLNDVPPVVTKTTGGRFVLLIPNSNPGLSDKVRYQRALKIEFSCKEEFYQWLVDLMGSFMDVNFGVDIGEIEKIAETRRSK